MSILDEKEKNTIEAPEELTPEENDSREKLTSETLTLEDLELDVSEPSMTFTATLHFEFSDIFNAIEHIDPEPEREAPEDPEADAEIRSEAEEPEPVEPETEPEPETGSDIETESENTEITEEHPNEIPVEAETPAGEETEDKDSDIPEREDEPEHEDPVHEPEAESEPQSDNLEKPHENLAAKLKKQDAGTKKLVLTVCILFVIIAASIIVGLAAANSLVDNANAANEQKAAEMQANSKEVELAESIYDIAADEVIEDIAVPTYTLDELYALDLREKTGFTAEDLKVITRKGLVGCEEAFVKAEETYGVNSIFLISIASLESAHGTQMFRPNNMFGYGRTGFSSKEECIMTVAKGLGTRYLPPGGSLYGGSPTLKGVNKRYAANPQWYYKVGKYMQGYYAELASEKNGALDKFE